MIKERLRKLVVHEVPSLHVEMIMLRWWQTAGIISLRNIFQYLHSWLSWPINLLNSWNCWVILAFSAFVVITYTAWSNSSGEFLGSSTSVIMLLIQCSIGEKRLTQSNSIFCFSYISHSLSCCDKIFTSHHCIIYYNQATHFIRH